MKYDLIAEAYKSMLLETVFHPKLDENGRSVKIYEPYESTNEKSWEDNNSIATITPGHSVLDNNPKFQSWDHFNVKDWNSIEGQGNFQEPSINNPSGKRLATGVVIHEDDGRVWVIHPTNQFGGYDTTFPKGKVDPGINPRANAIKEAAEESGLKVELTGHATDVERSTSFTRYYHARRIGGHPKDMGWESQAVSLVPKDKLKDFANHYNDKSIVQSTINKN